MQCAYSLLVHRSRGALHTVIQRFTSKDTVPAEDSDLRDISYPTYKPKDSQESLVKKRARLTWQSRKRGIAENCLLFSTFADKYLNDLTADQLIMYDKLLNTADNDWDMYYWMTGARSIPREFDNEIMQLLQKHCKNEEKSERFEQPPLNYEPIDKKV
ncbi:succinate dehydrogenase assembly factor 2-B, mitochondrial-like [Styela clava]